MDLDTQNKNEKLPISGLRAKSGDLADLPPVKSLERQAQLTYDSRTKKVAPERIAQESWATALG